MGTSKNVFEEDILMLKKHYEMIDLNTVQNLIYESRELTSSKTGMLITFDDGLSDHFEAAKLLNKHGINATFFIPTCIVEEKLPANPIIIHYCIAKYGISKFLEFFNTALGKLNVNDDKLKISFIKGQDDPWDIIKQIKIAFKYNIHHTLAREILLDIYENSLLKDESNIFELMHLSENQIQSMISMGHSFGVHTHSHISVGPTELSESEKQIELLKPKEILEKRFNISVDSFSYPFGETKDCLSEQELPSYLKEYKLIFTVDEILNTEKTSPFELGRYQPLSSDTTPLLQEKLTKIEKGWKN